MTEDQEKRLRELLQEHHEAAFAYAHATNETWNERHEVASTSREAIVSFVREQRDATLNVLDDLLQAIYGANSGHGYTREADLNALGAAIEKAREFLESHKQ